MKSRAIVLTPHASRYVQQLCKHWAHKFETEHSPTRGRIALPLGEAALDADERALTLEVNAHREEDLASLRQVVQTHVERFAFRETLAFEWILVDHS